MLRSTLRSTLGAGLCAATIGCGNAPADDDNPFADGGGAELGSGTALDDTDGSQASSDGGTVASDSTGAVDAIDDAQVVSAAFPPTLACGASSSATITIRNTGTSTWTRAAGFKLGAVDDADPLGPGRIDLADGDVVEPGETHDFSIPLLGPDATGELTSDWQMVHEGVQWFGDVQTAAVVVDCVPPEIDLTTVQVVGSPDVFGFAVTSEITALEFRPGTIHVDHTMRGLWPPVVIADDGTEQEATIWVFFHIDGTWYATGGERLRPSQFEKELSQPSAIGPGWLYDPNRWGPMTAYVPAPGEWVGFMVVAGSTRSDDHVIVSERTGVVVVPFPADGVETLFPPFAWEELP
jgi:hypothetical protein